MRINRYISLCGICSRRKAEDFINDGKVTINGKIAVLFDTVEDTDIVELNGKLIKPEKEKITLAYYKPAGIECTADISVENNIISFIDYPKRLFTVGRLDKESEGLILLTNDGELCYKLTKASELHEKEYEVSVDKPISAGFISKMSFGVEILGKITSPCKVVKTSQNMFKITLVQGLNRQIRRMCEVLGYRVINLKRIRIDRLKIDGIKPGTYKYLDEKDIISFFNYK